MKIMKDKKRETIEPGANRKLTWRKPVLHKLLPFDSTSNTLGGGADGGISATS